MEIRRPFVNCILKVILTILCKIECKEYIEALYNNKPLLVVFNHINFLEVPILVTHSYPLNVTGLVKSETWKNPIFAFIFNTYKAIPIDRRGAFSDSFKQVKQMIDNGFYMCISPEGTRSKNGVLGRGKAGIVYLALEADVPILPVAHYGGENIWQNMRKFKRTKFHFKAGKPFRIKFEGKPDKDEREIITSEVMGQIAKLLPEEMRGIYSEQALQECKYLEYI
ncbi:MAG: 1-acyl-sn-glycerol-3-phosphate acyltransferase [Treponema sp.]|nr:1-acyl-sn-glycerol-3-phosphate acyltransferase [Treponema sp.]MCL2250310.1 1-acyl-sn-glycerol-3-phosphate acyltransferase [Treponema sp.]